MSTLTAQPGSPGTAPRRAARAGTTDAAHRGRLTMSEKVVEKIAGQAASEVSAAGGTTGGFLGIGAQTDLSARPKVDVELYGATANVTVDLAVAYPTPIRRATDRVRHHLIDRVRALTGVEVTRVDINVTAFQATDDTSPVGAGTKPGTLR